MSSWMDVRNSFLSPFVFLETPDAESKQHVEGNNTGVYALCLCRGGSKGIKKKNIRIVAGKPLLCWCLDAALESNVFQKVFLSTDDSAIERIGQKHGYQIHQRDPATATDGASSESGIADFLKAHPECHTLCLLQATSPQTRAADLKGAYQEFCVSKADSLVTVVRSHRFLWEKNENGHAVAKNYDPAKRPLRQEWDGELMENGAFYFFTTKSFQTSNSRLSGHVVAYEMDAESLVEIDEPRDLDVVQRILNERMVDKESKKEPMKSAKIIAEIGINHNGSMDLCKKMIMAAHFSGCTFAKIQKRNPDLCIPKDQKSKIRSTPWGDMTYIDYKRKIEFTEEQIAELCEFANTIGITLFASVWDKDSVDVMAKYSTISKIPSALITDLELCAYARSKFSHLIISTGMSTEEEIEACVQACSPDVIMHTNSTYPCPPEDLNLKYILHLKEKYPEAEIGYSGHEYGIVTTFASLALGATWIERHITLDRFMWGSDQLSSVEIPGLLKLVKGSTDVMAAVQYPPGERRLFEGELSKKKSLRPTTK